MKSIKEYLDTDLEESNKPRDYIGASIIGSNCLRQIWYEYKGYPQDSHSAKQKRTLDIGKSLENQIFKWIFDAGIKFKFPDSALKDKEFEYFQGTPDAYLVDDNNKPYAILEIKTMNNANFNKFVKHGIHEVNIKYPAQVQSYMGFSGLQETCVVGLNKDTSDIHEQILEFDEIEYWGLKKKAEIINFCTEPPPKVNNSPLWYECKMCAFRKICHS